MFSFTRSVSHPARWRRRTQALTVGAAVGGLVLATQVLPASADPLPGGASRAGALAVAQPPAGRTWIQGVVTDQAGHALTNVNVEIWSADPNASVPVASNLSYAGTPAGAAYQPGVFRVEVPSGAAYRVSLSSVGGREDGDKYRMARIGGGRPIQGRTDARSTFRAVPGRTLDLGTVQLARQGKVASKVKVIKPRKARSAKPKITVHVISRYVTNPTGRVRVTVDGKTIMRRLGATAGGEVQVRLPKAKSGTQVVRATYLGSSTVAKSKSKPVRLKSRR